ncbi:MAG TPA: histidine phosphatase family protein [Acidimicrobiales bacterium]|nr:histidine phosphatase family protein [Acidimicrobiales bacterium]
MLILVRHGESEANVSGLLLGRTDSALTALGRWQAGRIGAALTATRLQGSRSGLVPLRILTSPLVRAQSTAQIIREALGPNAPAPEIEDRLIELDYGELEGLRPTELAEGVWANWRSDPSWRPPGGESFPDLHARVDPLWASLAGEAADGDVIAVSHVSPIKAAVAWALGAGPELAWKLSLGVASITRISMTRASPALVSFGETGHLLGL